jgi:hypothetical protein
VIRVVASVTTHEPLTITGRGQVSVAGTKYKLTPKAAPVELSADQLYAFKFQPSQSVARRIAHALNRGEKPLARVRVTLTDALGKVESEAHGVRLTKFRRR